MNKSTHSNVGRDRIEHFLKTLSDYRMLVIVPTVVCTVLALGYAVLKSNTWTARQSLVIRDDLVGKSFKPGRFESLESLKSAQETILEIARKPQVIRKALKNLGPNPMTLTSRKNWPSEKVIEDVQGTISIGAPNGAEFGKTEVILLSTKASSRERSRQFIELLLTEIDQKLREVRSAKIQSMSEELGQAVNTARISFEQSAQRLQEMESKFGADLSTLRSLNLQHSGDDSLQKTIIEIRSEQRRQASDVDLAKKQQEMLIKSFEDPAQYLMTSSDLLKMQPRLNQLVTGLSKAQLELAKVSGKFTEEHTEVKSGKRAILDIKIQILKEIQASIHSLGAKIEFGESRIQKLVDAETKLEERLSKLSSARVEYDKLEQEVGKKSEVLGQARQELAQVQSVGQTNIDLLTRVGEPQVSTRPDGPGKRAIVGAGLLGGLLIGLGLIMFTAPPYEDDDQLAVTGPEPTQPQPTQPPSLDPTPQPPVDGIPDPELQPARTPSGAPAYPSQPAAIQPSAIQPVAVQPAPDQPASDQPEPGQPASVVQPMNALAELSAQAESALSAKKDSPPARQASDTDTKEVKPVLKRRKTKTTFSADSEFAAAISKVSAKVDRNAPDPKPKPVARVKSITDLFNQSIVNETMPLDPESISGPAQDKDSQNDEPLTATQPLAQLEIVDEQSTFIKISSEPAPTPDRTARKEEPTPQIEISQQPFGLDLSQQPDHPGDPSETDKPNTEEPLAEQKLKHKSNVRPIDLTKIIGGLSQLSPDRPTDAASTTPPQDPQTVQNLQPRFAESTIELVDIKSIEPPADSNDDEWSNVEVVENTEIFDTDSDGESVSDEVASPEDQPGVLKKRQSAVTEQVFVKQIYASIDETDLAPVQDEPGSAPADSDSIESNRADAELSNTVTKEAEFADSAAGHDDDLEWSEDNSEPFSAEEIVRQLRAHQQQAAADSSSEAISNVPQQPADSDGNSNTEQPDIVLRSSEQDGDATVLDIRRRSDSTDDPSQPITGAAPLADQIKQLNDSIADFCAPLKRQKKANEDDESS